MYVLVDIEWITNNRDVLNPTQLAALRVDQRWQEKESFYARIKPLDASFHEWEHMAYTGGSATDFLNARTLRQVMDAFVEWSDSEDVLCFWHEDSVTTFRTAYRLIYKVGFEGRILILQDYVFPYLRDRGIKAGNPFKLATRCGLEPPIPKHHADNDVQAMIRALAGIDYPQSRLAGEAVAPKKAPAPCLSMPDAERPYQFDELNGLFHKRGCPAIPTVTQLSGHMNLKYMMRKHLRICPDCMKQELHDARVKRNQDTIGRTDFTFVYTVTSDVFHRRDCKVVLQAAHEIRGAAYYQTVLDTGRRPCKICNPSAQTWTDIKATMRKKKRPNKAKSEPERSLSDAEKRAIARFHQAKSERISGKDTQFETDVEKQDFYTLTQTRYAFWAAEGYRTFHLRHCKKLHGIDHLKGFSRFKDAIRAGHKPCKYCNPREKHDLQYSIPITNQKNSKEKVSDLTYLCLAHGYPYTEEEAYFYFETPVGKWKINTTSRPYILYHINLVMTPNEERGYHRQPRIFLSLVDTFNYIHRHDRVIQERSFADSESAEVAAI